MLSVLNETGFWQKVVGPSVLDIADTCYNLSEPVYDFVARLTTLANIGLGSGSHYSTALSANDKLLVLSRESNHLRANDTGPRMSDPR